MRKLAERFDVSQMAIRVRLMQTGLADGPLRDPVAARERKDNP